MRQEHPLPGLGEEVLYSKKHVFSRNHRKEDTAKRSQLEKIQKFKINYTAESLSYVSRLK